MNKIPFTQSNFKTYTGKNYSEKLPPELLQIIFTYLKRKDLESCRLVNKRWNILAAETRSTIIQEENLDLFKECLEKWRKRIFFGLPKVPLPQTAIDIHKTSEKDDFLAYVPSKLVSKPLTINNFIEYMKMTRKPIVYKISDKILAKYGNRPGRCCINSQTPTN